MCSISTTIVVLLLATTFLYYGSDTDEIRQIKPRKSSDDSQVHSNNYANTGTIIAGHVTTEMSDDSQVHSNNYFSTVTIIDGHVTTEVSFNSAVDEQFHSLLPRAAYFDNRVRGKHKNAVVVLTHLIDGVKLVACKINNRLTRSVKGSSLKINPWIHYKFNCTHDNVLILCYDPPTPLNNSDVFIVYKNPENESEYISVQSEYPLFAPKERKPSSTVMVCTTVFDTPPHFGAWIRYQKTLGVDMVHINADESFLSSGAFNDTFFLKSLQNGFIQLQVWKEHLPPGALFYHSQALFYQDCLYRYLGVYDYCMCADTDDFLVLKDPGIHGLVKKIFINNRRRVINSAILQWIRYLEPANGFYPPEEEIKDGNLMRYFKAVKGVNEGEWRTKSIYRLSVMAELGIHQSMQFLTAGTSKQLAWKQCASVRETAAYVAHIKKQPKAMDRELKLCSDV
jgi:hypothetical protein